jgi:nicotinate phosphoribosyltransferase
MIEPNNIIKSMIDDDFYKFSMQAAILELFPDAVAHYRFINRGKQRFNKSFLGELQYRVCNCFPELAVTDEELKWYRKACPFLKTWYFDYLKNYRYNPDQVKISLGEDNNLVIDIEGKWCETVLWEVKLMATISELYFKIIDTNWNRDGEAERAKDKMNQLQDWSCITTDFGTRRRRDFKAQEIVVNIMRGFDKFVGTSNVYLSFLNGMIPKGTQAHEWYQGMQALFGIRHSNYFGMENWVKVYNGDLGIALTDTLGTDQFLKDFDLRFAKLFDGVRCDSGNEMEFVDKMVAHYKKLKIDPMTKTIIFSNALDCRKAVDIARYCRNVIRCAFGIGTFFSNDFTNSPALNMVIKLWSVNGIPVVKLSDDKGKVMGDPDAIRVTKWECFGTSLDV